MQRFKPYRKGSDRYQSFKEGKPHLRMPHDRTSDTLWRKKQEEIKITEHKVSSSSVVAEVPGQEQEQKQAPLEKSVVETKPSNADASRNDSNVTFRSGNDQLSEVQSDSLANDENMSDVPGSELMVMEEGYLLGEELERLHPMIEEPEREQVGMANNDEKVTTLMVYDTQAGKTDVPEWTSKLRSITRVMFPTGEASQQPEPIHRASPILEVLLCQL